eukprot:TRINITY_DN9409_c0_g1_i1.p1 TRINITY_DN9409_c0_g1~~TRINITY_DN9409_c0_g1_i1.p1  ORF type:complete len:268 (-),score=46.48 TRINITY_DN9409_c0_g1_i1:38-841(-)
MSTYQPYYDLALSLAKQAGVVVKDAFYAKKDITFKGAVDVVTETDKAVERMIMDGIRDVYPDHLFVAEETISEGLAEEVLTDAPTWLIDPIDGTTNFVHKFPFSCISIGFSINKEVVVGVVFNPILDELFTAIKGEGSFKNGERLNASSCVDFQNALVATGFPYDRSDESLDKNLGTLKNILQNCRAVRRAGSAALDVCYVAAGVFDMYFEKGVHAWDIAAGSLIATEAGATVTNETGGDLDLCNRHILVTTPGITSQALSILNNQQ